jgi:hypothetical protein
MAAKQLIVYPIRYIMIAIKSVHEKEKENLCLIQ